MVCTYKYLHENQYVTYLIHSFSLRASCYRIPSLAATLNEGVVDLKSLPIVRIRGYPGAAIPVILAVQHLMGLQVNGA